MKTRSGVETSPQIAIMGMVTNLSTADFKIDNTKGPVSFLVKNDTEARVQLYIKPELGGDFVPTYFEPGWNVELVREIQLNATAGLDLKWGY